MQKIIGIIAEFNPFHKGHEYLLAQAGEALKVVAMSGNWVQRGEPAIFDKWTRAEMALRSGADLVVELPVTVSVQGADYFAQGAVDILEKLGVEKIVFGSESDVDYTRISQLYAEQADEMVDFLMNLPDSMSYPEKTQLMWQEFAGIEFDGDTPNHVLALAYAKAAAKYKIQLSPVKRTSSFHSESLTERFVSATAIRKALLTGLSVEKTTPSALTDLYKGPQASWSAYFPFLKYKILSSEIRDVFQVNEELAVRTKLAVKTAEDFEQLVEQVHTKHYTKARVRRLMTYILLNIPRDFCLPEQIHVLGFSENGRSLLKNFSEKTIVRIGKEPWDGLTQRADEIYLLGNSDAGEQNFGRKPIIYK